MDFGNNSQEQALIKARQRRALQENTQQQTEIDAQVASRFRRRGQGLLTFLRQTGVDALGSA